MATAWDISTARYYDRSKLVSAQETSPYGVTFSPDGSKMYIAGYTTATVYQYTVSTPWDVSTATYANKSKAVFDQDVWLRDVTFSPDGSKMYTVGDSTDTVYQYTVSTPWDVSTATYATKLKDVSAQETSPYGVTFSPDGSKMYIAGYTTATVYQYTVSTPWDVSTATYAEKLKLVSDQDKYLSNVTFSPDGSKMYIAGRETATVYQYTVSTPWDVSTATYANKSKAVFDQDVWLRDVTFSPDGSKMYIAGDSTDTVYEYTLIVVAVTTYTPTSIIRANPTKLTANGLVELDVVEPITTRGFKYGEIEADTWDKSESNSYNEGTFSLTIDTNLVADTTYYIRAYAEGIWGTKYGSYLEFKTAYPYGGLKTEIKAEATAGSSDITAVGGKRSLTINNHLIQTQTLANIITKAYLAEYKDQKTKLVVEKPTPAPYEIGDTVERISAKLPYYVAGSALISYATVADAVHYYNLAGRDMIIRKLNVSFSAGNYTSILELED